MTFESAPCRSHRFRKKIKGVVSLTAASLTCWLPSTGCRWALNGVKNVNCQSITRSPWDKWWTPFVKRMTSWVGGMIPDSLKLFFMPFSFWAGCGFWANLRARRVSRKRVCVRCTGKRVGGGGGACGRAVAEWIERRCVSVCAQETCKLCCRQRMLPPKKSFGVARGCQVPKNTSSMHVVRCARGGGIVATLYWYVWFEKAHDAWLSLGDKDSKRIDIG